MPRGQTVKMTPSGNVLFPASIRRDYANGAEFKIIRKDGNIVLEPKVMPPTESKLKDEVWERFDAARESIAQDFARRGIDQAHIRRTIKKLRAQRRAESRR